MNKIFNNMPEVKLGLVAVSRDCFPMSLSERRRNAVAAACEARGEQVEVISTIVENERDMQKALAEIQDKGVNALLVFLGNFGPETPETLFAKFFQGPVMYMAAAEGDGDLIDGRGDAYCGMLNCSYNLGLRNLRAIIPAHPVGTAEEIAAAIAQYRPVLRAILALQNLKIITFGPRPQDFLACNAPIKPLYSLGVEIQENSELDLLMAYNDYNDQERIKAIAGEMAEELKTELDEDSILWRVAKLQATLEAWAEANKGCKQYVTFANKCWPAFESAFKCVPCYANSRLAAIGMPVACEVDIYGALSQYIGTVLTQEPCTLLDVNNTVPRSMYENAIAGKYPYALNDLFMGFHCGNTPICRLHDDAQIKYQLIMKRSLEPDSAPDITRGTLEGDMLPSLATMFRLHSSPDTKLQAYVAQGEILNIRTGSFGGIGVFAFPEMERFYRNVLIGKHYPHHTAVAFEHIGANFFEVLRYFGVQDIEYNRPAGQLYANENPFVK